MPLFGKKEAESAQSAPKDGSLAVGMKKPLGLKDRRLLLQQQQAELAAKAPPKFEAPKLRAKFVSKVKAALPKADLGAASTDESAQPAPPASQEGDKNIFKTISTPTPRQQSSAKALVTSHGTPPLPSPLVAKTVPGDLSAVVSKDLPVAVSKELPKTASKQSPTVVSKSLPAAVSKELPKIVPKELPKIVPKELPKIVPKELPKIVPKELPKIVPKELPKIVPKDLPKVSPKILSNPEAAGKASELAAAPGSAVGKTSFNTPPQSVPDSVAANSLSAKTAVGALKTSSPSSLAGPTKKSPAPKRSLVELLGKDAPALQTQKEHLAERAGAPPLADRKSVAASRSLASLEGAVRAAVSAAPALLSLKEPLTKVDPFLEKAVRDQVSEASDSQILSAIKNFHAKEGAFLLVRDFLNARWTDLRHRLLAKKDAPPKDAAATHTALAGELSKTKASVEKASEESRTPVAPSLTAEAVAREVSREFPRIADLKVWQECVEAFAVASAAADALLAKWQKQRQRDFEEATGVAVVERAKELALQGDSKTPFKEPPPSSLSEPCGSGSAERLGLQTQGSLQEGSLQEGSLQEGLRELPVDLPREMASELVRGGGDSSGEEQKALLILKDALNMERLKRLLPLLVRRHSYLLLLLHTRAKQRSLEEERKLRVQSASQAKANAARLPGASLAAAPKTFSPKTPFKRLGAAAAPLTSSSPAPPRQRPAGERESFAFGQEVARLFPAFDVWLVVGAVSFVESALLAGATDGGTDEFAHLPVMRLALQHLTSRELLSLGATCTRAKTLVQAFLRLSLSRLPFQVASPLSDIQYWFNALHFFTVGGCSLSPIRRLHRGGSAPLLQTLKKSREVFPLTQESVLQTVFVTLDRLPPEIIDKTDFFAPSPYKVQKDAPPGKRSTISLSIAEFAAEFRERAQVEREEAAWGECAQNVDEGLAALLFQQVRRTLRP